MKHKKKLKIKQLKHKMHIDAVITKYYNTRKGDKSGFIKEAEKEIIGDKTPEVNNIPSIIEKATDKFNQQLEFLVDPPSDIWKVDSNIQRKNALKQKMKEVKAETDSLGYTNPDSNFETLHHENFRLQTSNTMKDTQIANYQDRIKQLDAQNSKYEKAVFATMYQASKPIHFSSLQNELHEDGDFATNGNEQTSLRMLAKENEGIPLNTNVVENIINYSDLTQTEINEIMQKQGEEKDKLIDFVFDQNDML